MRSSVDAKNAHNQRPPPMNKLCVIIRTEGLSLQQQGVQAGHAVAEWISRYPSDWQNETLVYVKVKDEGDLLAYSAWFDVNGIMYILYRDVDLGHRYTVSPRQR